MIRRLVFPAWLLSFAAAACHGGHGGSVPGDADDRAPFHAIAEDEVVKVTGTEPFWGGQIADRKLTYTTPDQPKGIVIPVSRFGGRGGLSFSGQFDGRALTLAVTPGECSDGMSDRTYPYTVMLRIGGDLRHGCGWTDRQPLKMPE